LIFFQKPRAVMGKQKPLKKGGVEKKSLIARQQQLQQQQQQSPNSAAVPPILLKVRFFHFVTFCFILYFVEI